MKTWDSLTNEEKEEVTAKAKAWLEQHRKHVMRCINSFDAEYPPSGSDLFHPELWKSAHWLWFLSQEADRKFFSGRSA